MNKNISKTSICIGRFQPIHNGHIHLLRQATEKCDLLIVVLGSGDRPGDINNPFSDSNRIGMISSVIHTDEVLKDRDCSIQFIAVHDYMYSDTKWIQELRSKVSPMIEGEVTLYGHRKDSSSYYLDLFPDWGLEEVEEGIDGLSATSIREKFFKYKQIPENAIPIAVERYILHWFDSHAFRNLRAEYNLVSKQKKAWSKAPYPAPFVTADSIVIHKGRVLMIKRAAHPGKGLMALPGGYMDLAEDKDMMATALRELEEETQLVLKRKECKNYDDNPIIFASKRRSVRGRIITGAFLWVLEDDVDVDNQIIGSDDAEEAFWVPLEDLARKSHIIFEDHLEIITKMVGMI